MLINFLGQGVIRFKFIYHEFFEGGLKSKDCRELYQVEKVCCESGESQEKRGSQRFLRGQCGKEEINQLKHEQLKSLYRVVIIDIRGMG